MANVNVHPYQGSDVYCEHCKLPQQNQIHGDAVHILVTIGTGTWEWFGPADDFPLITADLTKRLGPPTQIGG
jgi:hypothetical protein